MAQGLCDCPAKEFPYCPLEDVSQRGHIMEHAGNKSLDISKQCTSGRIGRSLMKKKKRCSCTQVSQKCPQALHVLH